MKKVFLGILIGVGLIGGGWAVGREKLAEANYKDYPSAKEIPTYHLLSFHTRDDLNVLGFCRPCGDKALAVATKQADSKLDSIKREIESKLSGGRK